MKRFLLLPTAFLLPCACISVNTAAQTLNAGTVYRNWELDDRAYVKNGFVYIKAVQCDQRKGNSGHRTAHGPVRLHFTNGGYSGNGKDRLFAA